MSSNIPTIADELRRYVRTGDTDLFRAAWPGQNLIEKGLAARADLRGALVEAVEERAADWQPPAATRDLDVVALTRSKVEPMVRGLFPRAERAPVLAMVERSVVFLTPDTIAGVLRTESWDTTAWRLANLYLEGVGAELLSDDAPALLGMSEDTRCYVSPAYFDERRPFEDFVVHEVAHTFHNCKRAMVGLKQTRRREWLLDIAFARREVFAYASEAYSWILSRATSRAERIELATGLSDDFGTADDRVQPGEVAQVVREAVTRRNGWKAVLASCAPPRRTWRAGRAPTLADVER